MYKVGDQFKTYSLRNLGVIIFADERGALLDWDNGSRTWWDNKALKTQATIYIPPVIRKENLFLKTGLNGGLFMTCDGRSSNSVQTHGEVEFTITDGVLTNAEVIK